MTDWVAGMTGLIGVALGIFATSYWQWRQDKEKYRVMTFEKRLDIHQTLYSLNQSIYENIRNRAEITQYGNELKEFWKTKSLDLDKNTRISAMVLLSAVREYSRLLSNQGTEPRILDEKETALISKLNNNLRDIEEGVGTEHLSRVEHNSQDIHPSSASANSIGNKTTSWLKRNWHILLFCLATSATVGYLIFVAFSIIAPSNFTLQSWMVNRYQYACYGITGLASLLITIKGTRDKVIIGVVFLAVEVFLAGMLFQLLGFIIK